MEIRIETNISLANGFIISEKLKAVFFKEVITNHYRYVAYYNVKGKLVHYYKWYY